MKTFDEFFQDLNTYIQLKLSIPSHPTPSQAQSLAEAYKVLENSYNEPKIEINDLIIYAQDGKLIVQPDTLFGRLDVKVVDNKVVIRSFTKHKEEM